MSKASIGRLERSFGPRRVQVRLLRLVVAVGVLATGCSRLLGEPGRDSSPADSSSSRIQVDEVVAVGEPKADPERPAEDGTQVGVVQRDRRRRDNDIRFDRLSLDEGLSQSVVNCILQDSRGFMWFGTQDGLNRYDGYEFTVFKHDPEDPTSLSNSFISSLHEDQAGAIWIGTSGGGLNRFDRETEEFVRYRHSKDPHSLSHDVVSALYEDRDGVLWVGTYEGLDRFERETERFIRYYNGPDDPYSLGEGPVRSIYQDAEGVLWIGTSEGGLNRFDPETERFVRFGNDPEDPRSLSNDHVESILEDRDGVLWIGTEGGGLEEFDRATSRFIHYQHDADDPHSLSHDTIYEVYEDGNGALWIATEGGLDRLDRDTGQFIHYRLDPKDPHSLSVNEVFSILEDEAGVLWIGTYGGGLSKYDPAKNKFALWRSDPGDPNSLSEDMIWSVCEDRAGVLWIGTASQGLNRLDRQTGLFTHYLNDPDNKDSLSNNTVWSIHEDAEGLLWVGTSAGLERFDRQGEQFTLYEADTVSVIREDGSGSLWLGTFGGGLGKFDRETGQFTFFKNDPDDPHSLSYDSVAAIHQDRHGILWLGTLGGGLNRFDPETEEFVAYGNDLEDPHSLSNNVVLSVLSDSKDRIWVATYGGGLNKFDPETEQFTHYTERNGLPNDSLYGIVEDDDGYLWLSTNRGLSKFDPRTETFKNYDVGDGLQSNEFNQGAYHRSGSGELFFGGVSGLSAFYPDEVVDVAYIPPIVVTDFQLFNESVEVDDESPLQKPIIETDQITLSYEDDFISFEFAALHFSSPEENQYAYMMEGLDKDWNYVGTRRFAGYTNVPPGDYVFRVKGTNRDGVWNEQGASISIIIPPPFWQTWWFRISLAAVVVGGAMVVFRLRVGAVEARRLALETQVANRTGELSDALVELERSKRAAEAANRAKSVFLANMSHEFRTPLNAILGFTQLMNRDANLTSDQRENLEIVTRSGEHLLGLINDVLELSKIEAGRTTLKVQDFDLLLLLHGLEEMFRLRAEGKGLTLSLDLARDVPRYVRLDEGKLRQMLMNLLGNAVKFTQEGGVTLRVTAPPPVNGDTILRFEVGDTGPGIIPEELSALFDPFVQTASGEQSREGTGLGLPISLQFARLMGGDLSVSSEPGRGSDFIAQVRAQVAHHAAVSSGEPAREVTGLEPGQPTRRLLIADDQELNRKLLVKLLAPLGFELREAADGREAIEVWERWEPHLIWMDMRMPVVDGHEATRRIKATVKGQATVIIALTASALEEDRAAILAEGCDGYVRKPFRDSDLYDVLAEHLGVRFLYEEMEVVDGAAKGSFVGLSSPGPQRAEPHHLDLVEGVAALSPDWTEDLARATVLGDLDQILGLIEQIRDRDATLAQALADLAHDFDHDEILTVIQAAETH